VHGVHCGGAVGNADRFCEQCGKAVVRPGGRAGAHARRAAERAAEGLRERHAGEAYYRRVGGRHPHVFGWLVR
jgi:hypothetical protein